MLTAAGTANADPDPADTTTPVGGPSIARAEHVGRGDAPSISGDGRWLVYVTLDGERRTVVRRDLELGIDEELTPVPAGVRSGHSVQPVVSDDGCVVAVTTELPLDLFRDDDRGERWDVYRLVVPECEGTPGAWELVSSRADGSARDDVHPGSATAMSATGATMAVTHAWGGSTGITTVSLVDLTVPISSPARSTPVPALPAEAPTTVYRHRGASSPSLDAAGRRVAFVSDTTAHEALPDWGVGSAPGDVATSHVFVWDREDPDPFTRVRRLSAVGDEPTQTGAARPILAANGTVVVFESADPDLVPSVDVRCTDTCPTQVVRVDLQLDPATDPEWRTVVSARERTPTDAVPGTAPFVAGSQPSRLGGLDADGGQVVFVTTSNDLAPTSVAAASVDGLGDVLVAEVATARLRRVTDAIAPGVPAAHGTPTMSRTGRTIVFGTVVAPSIVPDLEPPPVSPDPDPPTDPVPADQVADLVTVSVTATVSAAPLDFGTVLVDWPSDELFVSVLNEGPGAFFPAIVESSIPEVTITDAGSCRPGHVVAAGDSCTVTAIFTPTDEEASAGTITVTETGHRPIGVAIAVTGRGGEPTLQATPAGLDLADTVVGSTSAAVGFVVSNVGWLPTIIEDVRVTGGHASDFVITSDGCRGVELEPQTGCAVEVGFRPTTDHRRTSAVVVSTTTGEYTAVVVAGAGRFEPAILVPEPRVHVGGSLGLAIGGFPAEVDVTVSFGDRGRPLATVRTDAEGRALVRFDVSRRERGGQRRLVASSVGGVQVDTVVELVRPPSVTFGIPGTGYG